MEYKITRMEEYSDKTFVRVDAPNVNVERWVQAGEDLVVVLSDMIAELKERFDAYVEPERPVIKSASEIEGVLSSVSEKSIDDAVLARSQAKAVKDLGSAEEDVRGEF